MLLGNYNQWNANVGREFAGVTNRVFKGSTCLSLFAPDIANAEISKAATPNGYYPPYSLVMPMVAGGLAATATASGAFTASIAGGRNAEAVIECTAALTATMQLVVSAIATINASGALTGTLSGKGNISAAFTGGATLTASLKAIANAVANITAGGTITGTPTAIGSMEATITSETELSPSALAASLWNSLAASYNEAGTMGAKLNAAGSGGVDYDALKQAVWEHTVEGSLSAEEIIRIVLSAISGETQGIGTSTEKYKSLDGSIDRIEATFDAEGNRLTVDLDGTA